MKNKPTETPQPRLETFAETMARKPGISEETVRAFQQVVQSLLDPQHDRKRQASVEKPLRAPARIRR